MSAPPLFGNLFISAGAMKAGTTWLYTVLSRHRNLLFTPEKEIHYFYAKYVDRGILKDERRLDNALSRYIGRVDPKTADIDRVRYDLHWVVAYLGQPLDDYWYRNLFFFERRHFYGCDFSNLYALLPTEAWPQISENCNKLRTLYTLRHPAKRLWSHVKFHLQVTNKLDLLTTWERKDFEQFARQSFIWDNAEYGQALDRMMGGLKGDQLKVIFFEDMHDAPGETLAEIERWLEIPAHKYSDQVLNQRVNESSPQPMPDFFPDLFAKDFERIGAEVEGHGLTVPASWK
jgi:hypothetical protein